MTYEQKTVPFAASELERPFLATFKVNFDLNTLTISKIGLQKLGQKDLEISFYNVQFPDEFTQISEFQNQKSKRYLISKSGIYDLEELCLNYKYLSKLSDFDLEMSMVTR